MKITTTSYAAFACHSAACAPPPAGHGGSSGGGAPAGHTFKNVHHARATYKNLVAKKDRTPEETARMNAAYAVVRSNDAAYGRRKAAEEGQRTGRGSDDGYDAMKDAMIERGTWSHRRYAKGY